MSCRSVLKAEAASAAVKVATMSWHSEQKILDRWLERETRDGRGIRSSSQLSEDSLSFSGRSEPGIRSCILANRIPELQVRFL